MRLASFCCLNTKRLLCSLVSSLRRRWSVGWRAGQGLVTYSSCSRENSSEARYVSRNKEAFIQLTPFMLSVVLSGMYLFFFHLSSLLYLTYLPTYLPSYFCTIATSLDSFNLQPRGSARHIQGLCVIACMLVCRLALARSLMISW